MTSSENQKHPITSDEIHSAQLTDTNRNQTQKAYNKHPMHPTAHTSHPLSFLSTTLPHPRSLFPHASTAHPQQKGSNLDTNAHAHAEAPKPHPHPSPSPFIQDSSTCSIHLSCHTLRGISQETVSKKKTNERTNKLKRRKRPARGRDGVEQTPPWSEEKRQKKRLCTPLPGKHDALCRSPHPQPPSVLISFVQSVPSSHQPTNRIIIIVNPVSTPLTTTR